MPQYQGIWTLQDAARLQSQQQWATDPLFENTTLLLQADNAPNAAQNNTFLDSSANAFTITRNGNLSQGSFTPFSATGWSNFFNGGSDRISNTSAGVMDVGTNNFTIEMWFFPTSTADQMLFEGPSNLGFQFYIISGVLSFGHNGAVVNYTLPSSFYNSWHHLCVVREGTGSNQVSLYVDGIRQAQGTLTTNITTTGFQVSRTSQYLVFGYISNLRVVKNSAVYTGAAFTIPTAPLTAIANTSLLICQSNGFRDASTNNFPLTIAGTTSVQAFAPFAPQFQYTPTVIGGSGYFNGTTNSLTLPAGAIPSGAGTAFTIEFWIYQSVLGGTVLRANGNGSSLSIGMNTNGTVSIDNVFVASILTTTGAATAGGWNHIAITRTTGNLYTIYINGVSAGSTTYAGSLGSQQSFIAYNTFTGAYTTAYISDFRCVNSLVYTAAFTPPTAPLTAVTNTNLLLNFTNAAITDGTMKNNLETVGNAQVSTSIVKYGTGSMAFDGSGDYLSSVSNAVNNLSGDFTVEAWIYRAVIGVLHPIFDLGDYVGASGLLFYVTSGNALAIFTNNGLAMSGGTIPATTWTHVALVRSGSGSGNTRLYVNGVSVGTPATNTATFSGRLLVGADLYNTAITNFMNGYIDDLRVTRGVARYTANFTPPQVALPRQ